MKKYICLALFLSLSLRTFASVERPRILIKNSEKQQLIDKINRYSWAKDVYNRFKDTVDPYVNKHVTDPEWILSRYQMEWQRPYYTGGTFLLETNGIVNGKVTSIGVNKVTNWWGDAPIYPTVRTASERRPKYLDGGYAVWSPALENVETYSADGFHWLVSTKPGSSKKFWTNAGFLTSRMNRTINRYAMFSAFLYWMTGQEKYGRFAADILMLTTAGIYEKEILHQKYTSQTGILTCQTLNDSEDYGVFLPIIYDFIHDYLVKNHNKLSTTLHTPYGNVTYHIGTNDYIYTAFEKLISVALHSGSSGNNWQIVESPMLIYSALAMKDPEKERHYMSYYLEKTTIYQEPLPVYIQKFDRDGMWYESFVYHGYPLRYLQIGTYAADLNGYKVYNDFPTLYKMNYVIGERSFPNGRAPGFGDTSFVRNDPEPIEIAMGVAARNNDTFQYAAMERVLSQLIKSKAYSRNNLPATEFGFIPFLAGVGEISENTISEEQKRSQIIIPEHGITNTFILRNGNDEYNGLMLVIAGGKTDHNHGHGPAMELYGKGYVLGSDYGSTSAVYESDLHRKFYGHWAAHNNVLVNAQSRVPSRWERDPIFYEKMEPFPDIRAISKQSSFTLVSFYDFKPDADHLRLNGIIRTSPSTGYYVDIYRSKSRKWGPQTNDYLYHNLAHSLTLLDSSKQTIAMSSTMPRESLNGVGDELDVGPGYDYYNNLNKTVNNFSGKVTGIFKLDTDVSGDNDVFMKFFINPASNRTYFTAKCPFAFTAPAEYYKAQLPTPVFVARTHGEAATTPFALIFEPYQGISKSSIESVEYFSNPKDVGFIGMTVKSRQIDNLEQGHKETIFNSVNSEKKYIDSKYFFQGSYGVVSETASGIKYIYLGSGIKMGISNIAFIETINKSDIAANLNIENGKHLFSSIKPARVSIFFNNSDSETQFSQYALFLKSDNNALIQCSESTNIIPNSASPNSGYIQGIVPSGYDREIIIAKKGVSAYSETQCELNIKYNGVAKKLEADGRFRKNSELLVVLKDSDGIKKENVTLFFHQNRIVSSLLTISNISSTEIRLTYPLSERERGNYSLKVRDNYNTDFYTNFNLTFIEEESAFSMFPNPFDYKRDSHIVFDILNYEKRNIKELLILDLGGNMIRRLTDQISESNELSWNCKDENENYVSSGLYFVVIKHVAEGKNQIATQKIIIK